MSLADLGKIGIHEILETANSEIAVRGFSSSLPFDPYSKEVNAVGAIAIACGAKEKDLSSWDGDLQNAPVPTHRWPVFMETITYLEAMMDMDIDEWCQIHDIDSTTRVIESSRNKIIISII